MKRTAGTCISVQIVQRVCVVLLLITLVPLIAWAASDNAVINVSLNRTRPQPGETIEVRVEVIKDNAPSNESIRAVLLRPSTGTSELILEKVSSSRSQYRSEIKLGSQAAEGIYVIHAWVGEAAKPTVVGKATFLLGRVVTDFFVANYLDEKQPAEDLDSYLKEFRGIGGNFLVAHNLVTPTRVYYPSKIAATNIPRSVPDIVELVLSRADKSGYAVLLSVSWDMTRQSPYKDRMAEIKAISKELYALYKHHPSLAGFYSYQEGSGTYYVPFVREFSAHIKSIHPNLLTACAPHMDDPLLAGYLSTVEELDILFYQTGVMASYRTDNRKKYPFRRLKDFGSLAAGAKRLQNKISINHVELFGYLENRLNPDTAATSYENIYGQILSAATVTDADGISFFTYQAHVHVPRKKWDEVKRSHAAVADGVKAFNLITSRVSKQRNPLTVYFPYSDWIIERWPNYFLPALDAFRVLGKPVDVLPYVPPLEESVYPYYPFHMNKDVLTRLLKEPTVLVLPNVSGFQQTDSDLIKAFVEQGGVVVAFGPQIPMGRSYERKELFGVDESEVMKKHAAVLIKEAVGERVTAGSRFGLKETELPGWTIGNAKVIAAFEDGSAAIVANRFGKGTTISFFTDAWTAARDFPELVRDVLDHALKAQGVDSMVDIVGANENIDVAVGKTATGFSVAVVNHNLSDLNVMLRPRRSAADQRWTDLVSDKVIDTTASDRSLKLTVPGNGFRALEFR
ncbi:MAG TPA: alpha-amylase family protein [Pyrinomonadaceae bacterium]|nr:alpha-amylase family protein [Pyrinomonadaceae bacterium]